jgi:hypothetical protein
MSSIYIKRMAHSGTSAWPNNKTLKLAKEQFHAFLSEYGFYGTWEELTYSGRLKFLYRAQNIQAGGIKGRNPKEAA